MEIARSAETSKPPGMRPAAVGLAILLNGGLLAAVEVLRHSGTPAEQPKEFVDVVLVPPRPAVPKPAAPLPVPSPQAPAPQPAAPRPGVTAPETRAEAGEDALPALWSLVCRQIPADLRHLRPDCLEPGDAFAVRSGPVTAGIADQRLRDAPIGDLLGGKFAGKDRYQIEVMLGLRSTSLGTAYHVPVDYGLPDKPVDHTDTERILGPSPIPDQVTVSK